METHLAAAGIQVGEAACRVLLEARVESPVVTEACLSYVSSNLPDGLLHDVPGGIAALGANGGMPGGGGPGKTRGPAPGSCGFGMGILCPSAA